MRVAITGGIAEGKSTVLDLLSAMGFEVASSDAFAREVYDREDVQSKLAALMNVAEPVDRAVLRNAIAENPVIRREVNRIMHPLIGELTSQSSATFFEVPLLFEACLHYRYDRVWVVTCGVDEQIRRLQARYGPKASVEAILGAQVSSSVRQAFADRIIRTNQPIEAVKGELSVAVADTLG